MAYNQKRVPLDAGNLPINSNYNESSDAHEPTKGAGNAARILIADGDHVAVGARSDAESSGDLTGDFSLIALTKEMLSLFRVT